MSNSDQLRVQNVNLPPDKLSNGLGILLNDGGVHKVTKIGEWESE